MLLYEKQHGFMVRSPFAVLLEGVLFWRCSRYFSARENKKRANPLSNAGVVVAVAAESDKSNFGWISYLQTQCYTTMLFLHRLYNCKKGGVQCRRKQSALLDIEWCIRHLQRFHIKQKRRRILPTHFFKCAWWRFTLLRVWSGGKKERGKKSCLYKNHSMRTFLHASISCVYPTKPIYLCYIYSEEKGKKLAKSPIFVDFFLRRWRRQT